jgi:hypothetical protein
MDTTGIPASDLYTARDQVALVDVPEQLTAYVDGGGPLDGREFAAAARLLYGVSHAAHFLAKSVFGQAPEVRPLEALWWRPAGAHDWSWRAFVTQPDPIDEGLLAEVLDRRAGRTARCAASRSDGGRKVSAPRSSTVAAPRTCLR